MDTSQVTTDASEHILGQLQLTELVDSLTNGVLMFDGEQKILIANPVIKQLMPRTEKFTLRDFLALFQPEGETIEAIPVAQIQKGIWKRINLPEAIEVVLKTGQVIHFVKLSFEGRIYEMFVTGVRNHEEQISGGAIILHDITHFTEIDRMKTEFVSVASHQLRTPLTAMKLFLEMLADGQVGELNEIQKEYIDNIMQSNARMIQLVNDLLNVSRLETGKLKIEPKVTELNQFIQEIVDDAAPLAEAQKCQLVFHKSEEAISLSIDPNLMRQAIHNLIMNAIRYSVGDNRQIEVTLKLERAADPGVGWSANNIEDHQQFLKQRLNDQAVISVKDHGIGIPEAAKNRLFEKFFRADNAVKTVSTGSGLGLYVLKMIVEAAGGRVWLDSVEDQGTTFFVGLPLWGKGE